jgi:hypothetical protein
MQQVVCDRRIEASLSRWLGARGFVVQRLQLGGPLMEVGMPCWSELFVGNAEEIGAALRVHEETTWSAPPRILACASLPGLKPSLPTSEHPGPERLTELACEVVRSDEPTTFWQSVQRNLELDEPIDPVCGAYVMDSRWVTLFGRLSDQDLEQLASRWSCELDRAGREIPSRTRAAHTTLESIRRTCRLALVAKRDLVYHWTL